MRPLRHLEIGTSGQALVEITVRTVHSRFLLLPSTLVNALIVGILGKAQARYGIEICAFAFLSFSSTNTFLRNLYGWVGGLGAGSTWKLDDSPRWCRVEPSRRWLPWWRIR